MPRPSTQAEYLASLVPPSARALSRRTMLESALGVGALVATPARSPPAAVAAAEPVRGRHGRRRRGDRHRQLGSNQSDAVPKAAVQSVMDAFRRPTAA